MKSLVEIEREVQLLNRIIDCYEWEYALDLAAISMRLLTAVALVYGMAVGNMDQGLILMICFGSLCIGLRLVWLAVSIWHQATKRELERIRGASHARTRD